MTNKSNGGSDEKGTSFPFLTACSLNLFHTPYFTCRYGTTPQSISGNDPELLSQIENSLRSFEDVCEYPPNQAFIGNIDPNNLPPRPWGKNGDPTGKSVNRLTSVNLQTQTTGPFGDILNEEYFYGLIKIADVFDLVILEQAFSVECSELLKNNTITDKWDLSGFEKGVAIEIIKNEVENGALPLEKKGALVGCIKGAHPEDENLQAHTILENLSSKATAVYAVQHLLRRSGIDPGSVDYIIET